jgi:hypothetical protein
MNLSGVNGRQKHGRLLKIQHNFEDLPIRQTTSLTLSSRSLHGQLIPKRQLAQLAGAVFAGRWIGMNFVQEAEAVMSTFPKPLYDTACPASHVPIQRNTVFFSVLLWLSDHGAKGLISVPATIGNRDRADQSANVHQRVLSSALP